MPRVSKKLSIIHYGHPSLLRAAKPVSAVDQEIRELAVEMISMMYAAPGVGLAAPQVNVSRHMCVIGVDEGREKTELVLINPKIVSVFGLEMVMEEGCLSFPGIHTHIIRPSGVEIEAIGLDEKPIKLRAEGFLARVIQHEIDHLNGVLFIDYLAEQERQRLENSLERLKGKTIKKFGLASVAQK
ncbi:MAG: peptide deformylase [Spirochaetota bacterium]|jgi:peptide deformylase|nr:peptide deformylase [Spirochaetota bacterium]